MWSRNWLQRRDHGRDVLHMLNDELLTEDNLAYTNYLRMRNKEFEILLKGIETTIMKQDTNMRCSISPKNRLQLTLRFLATGESYRSLMYATRIHETTISRIVPEVCEAIYNFLKKDYLTVSYLVFSLH
ncbi:hypothetical protein MML48_9g00000113 [Holotrichia oblita]|uniref:Uncharacterized protein n=1 Tax=Holotrichia oblita TaxID=644536 RepID=A0ACB9SPJ8_HOLOL|nr:hypothetical protein MML48_9g00000113 [Holotrichia oblita]